MRYAEVSSSVIDTFPAKERSRLMCSERKPVFRVGQLRPAVSRLKKLRSGQLFPKRPRRFLCTELPAAEKLNLLKRPRSHQQRPTSPNIVPREIALTSPKPWKGTRPRFGAKVALLISKCPMATVRQ